MQRIWIPLVWLVCSIIAISCIVASTGFSPQNHPEPLEVENGTGDGDYWEGQSVALVFQLAPMLPTGRNESDYVFSHWEIVSGDGRLINPNELNANYLMGSEPAHVRAVFLQRQPGGQSDDLRKPVSTSLASDETTGSKYRKIGLNGFPLPDEKPQAAEETDEQPEETFIDAFHHSLTYQTTDVYIPIQGAEFPLLIRRNWTPETWNDTTGLAPQERPDRPFGLGWRSNLCATIEFVWPDKGARPTANVTDENGVSYRFMAYGPAGAVRNTFSTRYLPLAENRHQQEVLATTLEHLGGNWFRFTRKMGSTLYFELTNESRTVRTSTASEPPPVVAQPGSQIDLIPDPDEPSRESFHRWARLATLHDRFGNVMTYSYEQTPHQLFPSSISLRGKTLTIAYGANQHVQRVTDPRGNEINYSYESIGPKRSLTGLSQVELAPLATTSYIYSFASELDPSPRAPKVPQVVQGSQTITLRPEEPISLFHYCDLASIRDPLANETSFEYAFDRSRKAFFRFEDPTGLASYGGWYSPAGNPRNVTKVTTPETTASFQNNSSTWLDPWKSMNDQAQPAGARVMRVRDAAGGSWTWTFSEGEAMNMLDFVNIPTPGRFSAQLMIQYLKMEVLTPEGGSMEATFDKSAGMALKSFRDVGATAATRFEYTDRFDFASRQPFMTELGPLLAKYPVQYWGDPTKQIDGNGKAKAFAYDATWRVMSRITDEENRVSNYDIDPTNGNRKVERVSGPTGSNTTEFNYGSGVFSGILISKKVLGGTTGSSGPGDFVTTYTPDGTGNIVNESTGSLPPTIYEYDENNNRTSSTDPRGNKTTFVYDARNRLVSIDPPGPGNRTISYDARGNKIAERDENGNAALREFDGIGRVTAQARDMNGNGIMDAADLITRVQYTPLGSKRLITDPRGNSTINTYDGLNRLRQTTDALSNITTFSYEGPNTGGLQFGMGFQLTQITDARGIRTEISYDNAFRETSRSVEYKSGVYSIIRFERDGVGNVIRETDPLNQVTIRTYDAQNRVLTTKFADNSSVANFYNGAGNVWKTVDELGNDNLSDFDSAGRPIAVHSPPVDDGTGVLRRAVTRTTYDANSNPLTVTNPRGFDTQFSYDARNRKLTETRPGGYFLEWRYDAVGNVNGSFDARRNFTETSYDAANRPWKVTQPAIPVFGGGNAQPITITTYDKNGNVETVTDPNGRTIRNTYDALNRLRTTTDAAGIVVTNDYDSVGNLVAVLDGKNQRTAFVYDGLNRNTRIADALNKATNFEFDGMNKTARVDANGQRTEYTYDTRHRLTAVNYVDRPQDNRTLIYDLGGNLLSVTEATPGRTVSYTYDALRRQLTETSGGLTHQYRYDLAGNRVSCTYGGSGLRLVSTYDGQNRLASLKEGSNTTSYTYDPNGNVLTKTLPNGDVAASVYDAVGRTISLTGKNGANAALYSYGYEYDVAGNVKRVNETYADATQNRSVTNDYDAINRLVTESVTGLGAVTTTFSYDAAHNRTGMRKSNASSSYNYNEANQLTEFSENSRTVRFVYDNNGNRITRSEGNSTDAFIWDPENRLIGLTKQSAEGAGTYAWDYDYRTRRIRLNTPAAPSIQVIFSGGTSVRELQNGLPTVDYVRGSDWGGGVGGILYSLRDTVPSFTHYNRRGDVTAKTNGDGTMTYQAKYEAFGKRTSETGSTQDRQKSNTKDEDIPGYANEGFRFRDLETGAFISKDPLGFVDGPNVYAYVVQNPWTKFDPLGLKLKKTTKELTNEKGQKIKAVHLSFSGKVIFHGKSAKMSSKEQKRVLLAITKGIEKVYSKTEDTRYKLSMTVDLKIAFSQSEIEKDDHVINIVDNVTKKRNTPGQAWVGGKVANLDKDYIKSPKFGKYAAHEVGHNFGLRHANLTDVNNDEIDKQKKFGIDINNDNPINDIEKSNVMRYRGSQSSVNSAQIESINESIANRGGNTSLLDSFNDEPEL